MSLNIVKEFIQDLIDSKSIASSKIESYEEELNKLMEFASHKGKTSLSLDKKDLMTYLKNARTEKTESKNSFTLTILKSFYQFLADKKHLHYNPTLNLSFPKAWQTMPKFLSKPEIDMLFSQPDIKSDVGMRDLAMLHLLYVTGIRVSELITVKLIDINLEKSTVTYLGKNNKNRDIDLGKAMGSIKDYLFVRERLLRGKSSDLLFVNNYGDEMTRQQFWQIIVGYGENAGLGHITPHMLRHTFATRLLEEGADNLSITMLDSNESVKKADYQYLADDKLKSVYEKFHPRSR